MSELRYNLISREWVIIATDRAKRPKDFVKTKSESKPLPDHRKDCPFCPGNEAMGAGETFRLGDDKTWKTRVIFNKFPALSPNEKLERGLNGLYNKISGYGVAEVIIEHPKHNNFIGLMTDAEVEDIISTYKNRYLSIMEQKGIEAITIFKNHGPAAGTSLEHPHSQLIATPVVPPQVRNRIDNAVKFFDIIGQCIFCRTLKDELDKKVRIVLETEKFVSFIPYASASPFMIWILPKRHASSFAGIDAAEIKDLARHLKIVLAKLYHELCNPDFNYTIRSIPVRESEAEYFHWYLSIIPRISQPAGFELGSGMFINASLPEESAEFLRKVTGI